MKAVILAAGEGKRLRPLTEDKPKSLVEIWETTFLHRQLMQLKILGINDITAITGYKAEAIEKLGVKTIHNERFNDSNMVFSLSRYLPELKKSAADDVLVLYGDIAYRTQHLKDLIEIESQTEMAILGNLDWLELWSDRLEDPLSDAETFMYNSENLLEEIGKVPHSLDQVQSQYMGMIKSSCSFLSALLNNYLRDLAKDCKLKDMYMTDLIQRAANQRQVKVKNIHGGWVEMDTLKDYELYDQKSPHDFRLDRL